VTARNRFISSPAALRGKLVGAAARGQGASRGDSERCARSVTRLSVLACCRHPEGAGALLDRSACRAGYLEIRDKEASRARDDGGGRALCRRGSQVRNELFEERRERAWEAGRRRQARPRRAEETLGVAARGTLRAAARTCPVDRRAAARAGPTWSSPTRRCGHALLRPRDAGSSCWSRASASTNASATARLSSRRWTGGTGSAAERLP